MGSCGGPRDPFEEQADRDGKRASRRGKRATAGGVGGYEAAAELLVAPGRPMGSCGGHPVGYLSRCNRPLPQLEERAGAEWRAGYGGSFSPGERALGGRAPQGRRGEVC